MKAETDSVVDAFHERYYASQVWGGRTHWRGVACQKAPTDLWMYQEILAELRPDVVIETGSAAGGSALFLADVCQLIDWGQVISIDIEPRTRPAHERIKWITADSTALETLASVHALVDHFDRRLVILDSDHRAGHVERELELYAPLVTPGSLLIVEDTNINGHPVTPGWGPGPYEAVERFLQTHPKFRRDRNCEKFLLTFNPGGFLRRER